MNKEDMDRYKHLKETALCNIFATSIACKTLCFTIIFYITYNIIIYVNSIYMIVKIIYIFISTNCYILTKLSKPKMI